ncbi:hypothetical protein T492DRAFT_920317 [Pavlovales sp. CCMP2436]|nr:hypothetical protein T492DRAFT_920317 [Pavlovales sp. CCMP2436]
MRSDPVETSVYPAVSLAKGAHSCVLEAGDILYIPPGWWHHVEALDASISVLLPFNMSTSEQRAMQRPWTLDTWGKPVCTEASQVWSSID